MRTIRTLGIIGLGNIGGMLASRVLETGAVAAQDLYLTDHHPENQERLSSAWPQVHICPDERAVAASSDALIIAVAPPVMPDVIRQIRPVFPTDGLLVLTTSHLPDKVLRRLWSGEAITCLPTIASAVGRGTVLAHQLATPAAVDWFERLMRPSCRHLLWVADDGFAIPNSIAGCAPAFVGFIIDSFAKAASRAGMDQDPHLLRELAFEAFASTCELVQSGHADLTDLIQRVGSPGGITRTALSALEEGFPASLDELFHRGACRHQQADEEVEVRVGPSGL